MHADLNSPHDSAARRSSDEAIHRRRLVGAALIGLAIVAWWFARLLGLR